MAEYINKAELKAKIDALHPSVYDETPEWNDGYYSAMNDIMAEATVLPTIDIVHCKDCKHRRGGNCFKEEPKGFNHKKDTDYCSKGERRK